MMVALFAFVAQLAEDAQLVAGPRGQQRRDAMMALGGGVVFPARMHGRDPERPAIRGGDDLHVPAVIVVLSRPPKIESRCRARRAAPVNVDQGAVGVAAVLAPAEVRPGARPPIRVRPSYR
ncbi:hypothetical protein GCM10010435_24240 [Winogradskya consettensis]|uniref:Uncharacterized protein n=1 Tax=Winogradskya consettensis TaxID=113560 RepID=A0A919SZR4_9ACTN|nr:hypothetical protein Aco04nite_81560 [Actinoplanes consettensis]